MASVDSLRDAALAYAARGWKVFPCRPDASKAPITDHGLLDATTDPVQIAAWWASMPWNIGVCTGPESGFFLVDSDSYKPDIEAYVDENGAPPQVTTPSGGTHHFYTWPAGVAKMKPTLRKGVDVKGAGGYVLAPPSAIGGVEYVGEIAPIEAPQSLLIVIAILEGAVAERPGDRFNDEADWPEILEPAGWKYVADTVHDGEIVSAWTRPGKDEGISATTGIRSKGLGDGEPADLLYVFSTSTDFEAERGYDKYGAWCVLHGYDPRSTEAARAIAAELDGGASPRITPSLVEQAASSTPAPSEGVAVVSSAAAAPAYSFEAALPDTHLVSRYIEYGNSRCDAALEYHEAAALAILSTLTPRVRIPLAAFPDGGRTNLFIGLFGESSLSRKSTAQSFAAELLSVLAFDARMPDEFTGEAAMRELSNRSGKAAVWLPDELGTAIAQTHTRDFKSMTESLLLQLYGGKSFKYVTLGGTTTIDDVHLTVLGCATPDSFAGTGSKDMASGLLPRFAVVFPEARPAERPLADLTDDIRASKQAMYDAFLQVSLFVSQGGEVAFSPAAKGVLGAARFGGNSMTSRLGTAVYKVAALLALADLTWDVSEAHATAAVRICTRWAEGALRLRRFLSRSPANAAFAELLEGARGVLREIPELGVVAGRRQIDSATAAREIVRALGIDAASVERIRKTLEMTGEVSVTKSGDDLYWNVA